MPEFEYKLTNGKTLTLKGDTPPSDEEVESIAREQGVSLLPVDDIDISTEIPEINIKNNPAKFVNKETAKTEDFTDFRTFKQAIEEGRIGPKLAQVAGDFFRGINEPYDWAKPIVESHANKVAPGPMRDIFTESLGGVFSPLGIGSEALAGLGIVSSLPKWLKGPLPEVVDDIIPPIIPPTQASRVDARGIRALLPEVTETKVPGFIAGDAGVAINKPYQVDLGPLTYPSQINTGLADDISELRDPVTVLPREVEGIVDIPADLAARRGLSIGRPTDIPSVNNRLDRLLPGEIGEPTTGSLPYRQGEVYTGTGTARPGEPQLPSAIKQKIEREKAKVIETAGAAPEVAKTAAKVSTEVPELAPVIENPGFIKKFFSAFNKRETPESRFGAKLTSSIDTELSNQHPQLGELVKQTQVDSHIKAGTWINQYDKIVENLTDNEFSNFVKAVEGLEQPSSDKIKGAIRDYKALDKLISDEMTSTGAGLRSKDGTKVIPWSPAENYWPHLYTEDFFKSLKTDPTNVKQILTDKGMSPLEIDSLLGNSRQFGERLIDAQHAREANLPGYRVDKNVYRQHITDMAKRIVEAKNYGPLDLADVESPLMSLIQRSKNPEYSTEMMKKLLNRGDIGDFDSIDISRKATAAQAWLHLSTAGISNLNSLAMTPIQTNTQSFVKGLAEAIFASRETQEFAKESGALQNIFKEIFAAAIDDTTKFMPTKVYGLDAGERLMRTVSSSAGRSYAKQLFNEVKAGNASEFNVKRLQELTLTNVDDLLKQPELNPQQLKRAAFRTAELSQGLAEPQNLPQYWTGSGLANILTLFHKYQFAQTKIVKDLIKSQPLRAIPLLLGASQIAGEITGDSKAFIRGLIKSGVSGDETRIEDEIRGRGDFVGKKFGLDDSPLAARFIENMGQSFALGIYADIIEAMAGGGSDVLKQLAGSTLNDLMKVIDMGRDVVKGDYYKAGTKATSMVPLVGPAISAEMKN